MLLKIYEIVDYILIFVLLADLVLNFMKNLKVTIKNNDFLIILVKSFLIITVVAFIVLKFLTNNFDWIWLYFILLLIQSIVLARNIYLYKIKLSEKTKKNINKVNLLSRIKEKRKDNIENKRFIKRPKRGGYISIRTEEIKKEDFTTQQ